LDPRRRRAADPPRHRVRRAAARVHAPHAADPDRCHRVPFRIGGDGRADPRPPALLRRRDRAAQARGDRPPAPRIVRQRARPTKGKGTEMDKLIQEHRKRFGEFEVIEFVDEQKLAALREQLNLSVPVGLNWTWNYGSEVAELRNLYEKGKVNQWNAETDLDWSIPVRNDDFIVNPELSLLAQACKLLGKDEATQKAAAFDEINYLLSQLLHGEQAALQLCGQLTNV